MNYMAPNFNGIVGLVPDYARNVSANILPSSQLPPAKLNSFYNYFKQHLIELTNAGQFAQQAVQNAFIQQVGQPQLKNGMLWIPIRYNNGEISVLAAKLHPEGISLMNASNKKSTLLPFNNPAKSVEMLINEFVFGGKALKRALNMLSGRRYVFGQRGRK